MATTSNPSPNLAIVLGWTDGENAWGTPMNANLRLLDALIHLAVVSVTLNAPPGTLPPAGTRYIIAATPAATGAWVGQEKKVAYYTGSGWLFFTPLDGFRAALQGSSSFYRFDGTVWALEPASGGLGDLETRMDDAEAELALHDTAINTLESSLTTLTTIVSGHTDELALLTAAINALKLIQPVAVTASRDLAVTDNNKFLNLTSSSMIELGVPSSADVPHPVGTHILLRLQGPGRGRFVAASGVTINPPFGGDLEIGGPGATVSLYKRAAEIWDLSGQTRLIEAIAPGERLYYVPLATGTTVAVTPTTKRVIMDSAGAVTSLAIVMPASPIDGQVVRFVTTTAIGAVTHGGNGKTLRNPITSMTAGQAIAFQFYAPENIWTRY